MRLTKWLLLHKLIRPSFCPGLRLTGFSLAYSVSWNELQSTRQGVRLGLRRQLRSLSGKPHGSRRDMCATATLVSAKFGEVKYWAFAHLSRTSILASHSQNQAGTLMHNNWTLWNNLSSNHLDLIVQGARWYSWGLLSTGYCISTISANGNNMLIMPCSRGNRDQ